MQVDDVRSEGIERSGRCGKRFSRPVAVVAALAVVSLVTLVMAVLVIEPARVFLDRATSDAEFRERKVRLAGEGQPEGENHWGSLVAALRQFDDVAREASLSDPPLGVSGEAHMLASGRAALAVPQIDEALRSALAGSRHVRSFRMPGFFIHETLPEISMARDVAAAMIDRAFESAARNDWDAAIDDLELAVRLGAILSRQPSTPHAMSSGRIVMSVTAAIRAMDDQIAIPADVLGRLDAVVAAIADPDTAREVEQARLTMRAILVGLHGSRGRPLPLVTWGDRTRSGGTVFFDPVDPETDPRSFIAAIRVRWTMAKLATCESLVDEWFAALEARGEVSPATRWDRWPPAEIRTRLEQGRYMAVAAYLPHLGLLVDRRERVVFDRDATRLQLAVSRFTADVGSPPSSLDELVPRWISGPPVDPSGGGGYGLRQGDEGIVVYGFGPDGVDDGGKEDPEAGGDPLRTAAGFDVPLR